MESNDPIEQLRIKLDYLGLKERYLDENVASMEAMLQIHRGVPGSAHGQVFPTSARRK